LKTGSTDTALFCLSASAKRNNMQLISVVLGSKTSKARFAAATKLLDYGFANYAVVDEVKIPTITPTKVIGGIEAKVIGKVAGSSSLLVKKGKEKDIEVSMELADKITAPVEVNQIIGKLVFTLDGEVISEKEIYVDKAIRKANLFDVFKYMLKNLL